MKIAMATNLSRKKNGKIIRRKRYALILASEIVSLHSSPAACVSQMQYLKSNVVIFSLARKPEYTYEQVCSMQIKYKAEGW